MRCGPDTKTIALTPATSTTAKESVTRLVRRCTRLDVGVSIEVLGGSANVVVRNIGVTVCRLRPMSIARTVIGRVGKAFSIDRSAQETREAGLVGNLARGEGWPLHRSRRVVLRPVPARRDPTWTIASASSRLVKSPTASLG
jgi:hypothetical protein